MLMRVFTLCRTGRNGKQMYEKKNRIMHLPRVFTNMDLFHQTMLRSVLQSLQWERLAN